MFFVWWTLALIWDSFVFIHYSERALRPVLAFSFFAALNIVCIWYLGRRSFREFAVKFVSERTREKQVRMAEKIAKENIRKGL
jgi:hypothetical protein